MWGANDVWQVEQGAVGGGLNLEYVKRSTCDVAGFQGLGQCVLIHQTAAGTVDDTHAFFRFGDVFGAEDVGGCIGEWHVQRDEISAGKQGIQLNLFNAHFVGTLFREEGVIGDNLHFQATRAVADDATNVACANHAERFAGQLNAHKLGFFPFARMRGCAGFWDLAGNGEHHGDGVFGGGDHVAKRRVHNDHTLFRGGRFVHVVGADTSATHHLEVVGRGEDFLGHFGG